MDRVSRHKLLLITQSLSMLQSFALAYLTLTHRIHVSHVIALNLFQGVVNAFDDAVDITRGRVCIWTDVIGVVVAERIPVAAEADAETDAERETRPAIPPDEEWVRCAADPDAEAAVITLDAVHAAGVVPAFIANWSAVIRLRPRRASVIESLRFHSWLVVLQ